MASAGRSLEVAGSIHRSVAAGGRPCIAAAIVPSERSTSGCRNASACASSGNATFGDAYFAGSMSPSVLANSTLASEEPSLVLQRDHHTTVWCLALVRAT